MKIKQYNVRWIGIIFESLYMALPILSIINFLSISVVMYNTIKPFLLVHMPWVTLWMFILIIAGITTIAVLLTWMFLVPSMWALRGKQMFGKETREGDKKQ